LKSVAEVARIVIYAGACLMLANKVVDGRPRQQARLGSICSIDRTNAPREDGFFVFFTFILMELSDKSARQLFAQVKANPTRKRFGFGPHQYRPAKGIHLRGRVCDGL
jgi:hypothetical protein